MTKFECKNKKPYDSKEDALKSIAFMFRESFGGIVDLRPYKCKYCGKYHLTSLVK